MSDNFKIREVRIEIQPGVIVIADVSTVTDVKSLLQALGRQLQGSDPHGSRTEKVNPHEKPNDLGWTGADPASRVETRAELSAGVLQKSNLLAFKDDVPQLLRPHNFANVTEATLVLLFAVEAGLKRSSTDFDSFKALYDDQNIKSGSSLSVLLTNLRNAGYLEKKAYAMDRTIRLTAKGEKKAIDVLKSQVTS